ncbi:hypothetical protein NPX13_g508 [Xylaria arbuscula]|uniref:Uncharacterized protein n=1 Tax=Xylaria arbuscula TaxID=114810 RepID=A0A9W8NPB7_9PEZI|nr:hypothetical protein NPX13_g508 [Xylaria arbuscula]
MNLIITEEEESSAPPPCQDGPCAIIVSRNRPVLSKLLRVNRDAREAALAFYRVHLPCRMVTKEGKSKLSTVGGVIYINPEFDYIYLKPIEPREIVPFIHYIKSVKDPLGFGILNLVVRGLYDLESANPQDYDLSTRKSVTDMLKNLDRLYILDKLATRMVPSLAMMRQPPKYQVNRSCPIAAKGTKFQCIPRDPRAIGLDLKIIHQHKWPIFTSDGWRKLIHKWSPVELSVSATAAQENTPDIRHLIASQAGPGGRSPVYNRETAVAALSGEMDHWTKNGFADIYSRKDNWGEYITAEASDKEVEEALSVKSAFGFWVFPPEAMMLAKNHQQHNWFHVLDYTGFWPELWLWDLH